MTRRNKDGERKNKSDIGLASVKLTKKPCIGLTQENLIRVPSTKYLSALYTLASWSV